MRSIRAAIVALPLAACVSAEERAHRQAMQDDAQCLAMGAQYDTPVYYNCRMRLVEMRAADRRSRDASSDALMMMGLQMLQSNQQQQRQPSQTTCFRNGIYTNCSTW